MKSIRADFVRRSGPSRRQWMACGALATAAAAAVMWASASWQATERQQDQLRQALTEQQAPRPTSTAEPPRPYESHLREMLSARSIPWPQALTMLETTSVIGVTPMNVEFNTDGTVRLDVVFADYAVLLEYLSLLNAGEAELRWKLAQSQSQGAAGPGGNSSATLIGSWPAAPARSTR